jgi:hypothetical protein
MTMITEAFAERLIAEVRADRAAMKPGRRAHKAKHRASGKQVMTTTEKTYTFTDTAGDDEPVTCEAYEIADSLRPWFEDIPSFPECIPLLGQLQTFFTTGQGTAEELADVEAALGVRHEVTP